MRELILICATIVAVAGIIAGVAVWNLHVRANVEIARRTAPRQETPHERNLEQYLERFDRLVPGRHEQPHQPRDELAR